MTVLAIWLYFWGGVMVWGDLQSVATRTRLSTVLTIITWPISIPAAVISMRLFNK